MPNAPTSNRNSEILSEYFTDVEPLRELFRQYVAAQILPRHIFVIHGVPGVGKSSLVRMFRLHCKSVHVPVAVASGDEAKAELDVLYFKSPSGEERGWVPDLKADGIAFPTFSKTYEHYRAIKAKVDEQAKKAHHTSGTMRDIAEKAASKTAEAAGGAAMGAAIGSIFPGFGTALGGVLGGVLGGMSAEALVDWLRGFLTKPDLDLLLDPAKRLTSDFLIDLARAAEKRRIVLMLDAYKQMTALDDWTCDVGKRLHDANVLLVIAGRGLPDWNRTWDGWMAQAQVKELPPMNEDVMRELVQRYYATMREGEPNPAQVQDIIRFARGLPILGTSAVQLSVKYPDRAGDLKAVKPEAMGDLVDRIKEGVPEKMIPALEAAAIVRWFDQPLLRAVTGLADVREVYDELQGFTFVRPRVEGFALNDAVREIMDENLRVHDSEWHSLLHERAAAYFEKRLGHVTGEGAEHLGFELLYHRIHADEEEGIRLFQERAEELVRSRQDPRLRSLMDELNASRHFQLEKPNSRLWREYYNARLEHLKGRWTEAERVYRVLVEDHAAEPKLRAYALCDLGELEANNRPLYGSGIADRAIEHLNRARSLIPIDLKLTDVFSHLYTVYVYKGRLDDAIAILEERQRWLGKFGEPYRVISNHNELEEIYALIGNWKKSLDFNENAREELEKMPENIFLQARLTRSNPWVLIWTGRWKDAEDRSSFAVSIARRADDPGAAKWYLWHVALARGMQGFYRESDRSFRQTRESFDTWSQRDWATGMLLGVWGAVLTREGNLQRAAEYLDHSLDLKDTSGDRIGIPEVLVWRGLLEEVRGGLPRALDSYNSALELRWMGRRYFECSALAGIVRVKHAQGENANTPALIGEAENLAQRYEYNDHLASLRLTQGHIAWDGRIEDRENSSDAALIFYQQALIYALRFNRFLLDEVLTGRPQGTPLRPIIPYCASRGEEGQRMLTALRDWWKTGMNDVGIPRPDTISPIPEGISLLEAERIAREREPGEGAPQRTLLEQFEAALS